MSFFIDPFKFATAPPPSYTPLGDVLASCVFDLDATISDSYPGSGQLWANIEPTPADGSAQSAYDCNLGATSGSSTDDPTYNGSGPTAYWGHDGGDFFRNAGGNTAFLNQCGFGTGGQDFWCAAAFYFTASTTSQAFMGTSTLSNPGFVFYAVSSNAFRCGQRQGVTTSQVTTTSQFFADNTPTLAIMSHSHSTNTSRFWINNRTAESIAHTFTAGNANGGSTFDISAIGGGTRLQNGNRLYSAAMGNEYLDNTKAGLIFDALNARHGRTYA